MSKAKIVLFGAEGPYAATFSRVLAPHADLLGCVVRRKIDGALDVWLRHRIAAHEVPGFACQVWSIGAYADERFYRRLAKLGADLVISVGFPRRLPAQLCNGIARLGALNLHPALLPRDRGPCPIFWVFRRGDPECGVTLHQLGPELDTGDVLSSAKIETPFGVTGAQLSERLGALGAELVAQSLGRIMNEPWHLVPQPQDGGAWARKPIAEDLEVRADEWTAARLFHFVHGAKTFGTPWATLGGDTYYFADASAFDPGRKIPGEFVVLGDNLILKVKDGTVTLRLVRL